VAIAGLFALLDAEFALRVYIIECVGLLGANRLAECVLSVLHLQYLEAPGGADVVLWTFIEAQGEATPLGARL